MEWRRRDLGLQQCDCVAVEQKFHTDSSAAKMPNNHVWNHAVLVRNVTDVNAKSTRSPYDLRACSPQSDISLRCKTTDTRPVHRVVCPFMTRAQIILLPRVCPLLVTAPFLWLQCVEQFAGHCHIVAIAADIQETTQDGTVCSQLSRLLAAATSDTCFFFFFPHRSHVSFSRYSFFVRCPRSL